MGTRERWLRDEQDIACELAALDEWDRVQRSLLQVASSSPASPERSWRALVGTCIVESTNGQADIWWEPMTRGTLTKSDRLFEVRYRQIRYGLLGLAPGYLVSNLMPSIPQYVARLCALVLALAEYGLLVEYQLAQLPPSCRHTSMPPLTPRERDVLLGIVHGESDSAMASRLGISLATVRTHRQRLYRHLEVHSAQEAVLRSFSLRLLGWLDMPCTDAVNAVESAPARRPAGVAASLLA